MARAGGESQLSAVREFAAGLSSAARARHPTGVQRRGG